MAPTPGVLARAPVTVLLTGCLAAPPSAGDGGDPADSGPPITSTSRLGGSYNAHCAIRGGGALFCWGAGDAGQLGNGDGIDSDQPVQVIDGDDLLVAAVLGVAGGIHQTCTIMADRTVRCWGSNGLGQRGNGTTDTSLRAESSVSGLADAAIISAFGPHTCALDRGGSVWCWGRDADGELGTDAASGGVVEAVQMLDGAAPIDDALALSSGDYHSCVVRSDRRVWCTGRNAQGQLGRYATEEFECSRGMPRPLETGEGEYLEDASQVAGGYRSSCAIVGEAVFCWGDSRCGQLGDGTGVLACDAPTTDPCDDEGSSPPVAVALGSIPACSPVQIGAGRDFACALCKDGRVACWGDGARGKLGNDGEIGSTVPVEVFGIDDAVEIAIGYKSSCALLASDDEIVCWGEGDEGQLGNGEIGAGVFSARPVPVIGLPP